VVGLGWGIGLAAAPAVAEISGCDWRGVWAGALVSAVAAAGACWLSRARAWLGVLGLAALILAAALLQRDLLLGGVPRPSWEVAGWCALTGAPALAAYMPFVLILRSLRRLDACDGLEVVCQRAGTWLAGVAVVAITTAWTGAWAACAALLAVALLSSALLRDAMRAVLLFRIEAGGAGEWRIGYARASRLPPLLASESKRDGRCLFPTDGGRPATYRHADPYSPVAVWVPSWRKLLGARACLHVVMLGALASVALLLRSGVR